MLTGIIAVASHAGVVRPWSAFLMGSIAGLMYCVLCYILKVTYQDDPIEAF